MSDNYGYVIRQNPRSKRWEIFWKDKKLDIDFSRQADAEEWI